MHIRTGLKALIATSVLGMVVSILLFFTCPFAGQLAFIAQVREMHTEQAPHAAEPHALQAAPAGEAPGGLSMHFMFDPKARTYPAHETRILSIEVSLLGIVVLLVLSALAGQILRQRPVNLFGYLVVPRALAALIVLLTVWNVLFAAFLLGVEALRFREFCVT
jgi:hypothetical protein